MSVSNVSSTGQSILTALNASGGIDYSTLATNLANASEAPFSAAITARINKDNAQITSVGKIMASVSAFQQSMTALGDPSLLQNAPVSSNTSKVQISAISGAPNLSNINANISVNALATSSVATFTPVASSTSPLLSSLAAGDSVQLQFVADPSSSATSLPNPVSLNIDNTTTLSSLNDKINALNGFSSQIVQGSQGYYLEVNHGTGVNNRFAIKFTASSSNFISSSDGQSITTNDGLTNLLSASVTQGVDASISVDGIPATSSSNSFTNVIPGTVITAVNLTQPAIGNSPAETVNISSQVNTQNLTNAVTTLVTGFNTLVQTLSTESAYNVDPTKAGGLENNTIVHQLINQLRNFTTTPISGYSSQSHYLSELGVNTNPDGTLTLDTKVFSSLLSSSPDTIVAVMASIKSSNSSLVTISSVGPNTQTGYYSLTKLSNNSWQLGGAPIQVSGNNLIGQADPVSGLVLNMNAADQANAPIGSIFNVSYSQGMIERFNNLLTNLTQATSSINQIVTNANTDLTKQKDAQTALDAKTSASQQRYLQQFSALNSYILSSQSSQSTLTNMMTAWSYALK
jgi:flagellar hook-associated protein 2